ncbi:hypothetical protein [Atopomonas sediminilitoris]|uniref:hypothetical protein n=1 Tax=Atopomonas sediminilitoris TaxID=2919919 RepID=UPI001F4D418C|nr:hypothetical protein [Atopomonas sediminilitoris]MCJ8168854.1 hypothetical protein [Atopomonas sediminilitoris]
MSQPDIEIYIKEADFDAVHAWLSQAIGSSGEVQHKGQTRQFLLADRIPAVWTEKAVGRWHSLWLQSDATPWPDDITCAQAAHHALGIAVRCVPGSWQEADGEATADDWLEVKDGSVNPIVWRI